MRKLGLFLALAACAFAASSLLTDHNDFNRQAWVSTETTLKPSVVKAGLFGLVAKFPVNGGVMAQPLRIPGVTLADGTTHDTVLITTTSDPGDITGGNDLYLFDATAPGIGPLWHTNVGPIDIPQTSTLQWNARGGCFSTPGVDVAANAIFALCGISTQHWTLFKLRLTTGAILSSVVISAQVVGTGYCDPAGQGGCDPTSGANLLFNPLRQSSRLGVTVANGNVYLGFGSYADVAPWHGWAMAYRETDLAQVAVFCTTPNATGAGLWGSGGGYAVDGDGNLYVSTGNGDYDGAAAWGETILKLSPTLAVLDWFTPADWADLMANDKDLASTRIMLVPGTTLLLTGGKDYRGYKVDTTCMGHLQGSTPTCSGIPTQLWATGTDVDIQHQGIYGGMYMDGALYLPNTGGLVYGFHLTGTTINATPFIISPVDLAFPGATMTGSSNGSANKIIWATTVKGTSSGLMDPQPGTLHAWDPLTLTDIWNSDIAAADNLGTLSKFASPTVVNGRVWVSTNSDQVMVYGLKPTRMTMGALRRQQ